MDYKTLYQLSEEASNPFGKRISAQLEYAAELSAANENRYDGIVQKAIAYVSGQFVAEGAVTKNTMLKAEDILAPLSREAKSKTVVCVSHAHIDMNWQWGYDETVQITLATFRTMLQLMKEYPSFTFSQSQAACYEMTAKFAPELLSQIKARVAEGRWEVAATNWVEPDKNMPTGEEQTRHILYTKKYLSELLDIDPDTLTVDFEPDTFGHSVNVPEILAAGGVKYLYHCRGNFAPALYRWRAPSGSTVLVYRDPTCYNWDLKPTDFRCVPDFAKTYGLQKVLRVYGVGDHGGGSSRKDIELIADMDKWPVMPKFEFGTYRGFFDYVDSLGLPLKTVEGEQNFVFRGCYSTQSRIKAANRKNLTHFTQTEQAQALIGLSADSKTFCTDLDGAWHSHLFGHFHDILTGSGVVDTREYQLGKAQETAAALASVKTAALLALAEQVDTSCFASEKADLTRSTALGAGAGFDREIFASNSAEGKSRIFMLYHYGGEDCSRIAELTLWDYEGRTEALRVRDAKGRLLDFEILDSQPLHYWGHWYRRLLVRAAVKAYGYTVVAVDDGINEKRAVAYPPIFQRKEDVIDYTLENEFLRAEFDRNSAALLRLTDKSTGQIYSGEPFACFRFIEEENSKGMSGWVTGNYSRVTPLTSDVKIVNGSLHRGKLRQSFCVKAAFGKNSKLGVTVRLDAGDRFLRLDAECDFLEIGGETIPQLGFCCRSTGAKRILYDVPFGLLQRVPEDGDVVANSFAYADFGESGLILTTDSKYGFRAYREDLSAVLLRGSTDPDPFPELNRHRFTVGLGFSGGGENKILNDVRTFTPDIDTITLSAHSGGLPPECSLMTLVGDVVPSALKPAEDGRGIVVRVYNAIDKASAARLSFAVPVVDAELCDSLEKCVQKAAVTDGAVKFTVGANSVCTLRCIFDTDTKE